MPEIFRFRGIIISIFYHDHNPPHFHVRSGESRAAIEISTLRVLDGTLPPRKRKLVNEWASKHETELTNNWEAICNDRPPQKIQPLA